MAATGKKNRPAWLRWGMSGLLIIWAFILGVLVGQGSLASEQQLDSLRRLSLSWFGINFQKEDTDAGQAPLRDPDLSFYDQLAQNTAPRSTAPSPHPAPPAAQTSVQPLAAPSIVQPTAPANVRPANPPAVPDQTPVPPVAASPNSLNPGQPPAVRTAPLNQVRPYQPEAAAPSTPASSQVPSGRFTVQVGSFKEERQAQELVNRLRRGGFPAYVSRVEISGAGARLRVRVGGYENLEQAQNVATNLRLKENMAAYVTRGN